MLSLSKFGLSDDAKVVLGSSNPNNSEIFRLSFDFFLLRTLDTYIKKNNPPSEILGGEGAW